MQNNYHDNTKKIKEQSSSTSLVSIQFYLVQQVFSLLSILVPAAWLAL